MEKDGKYMGAGAAIAGAAIQAGSGLIGNIMNHNIAEKNLRAQQEQFEYQKQLNDTVMAREDTAHQREVADLIQSGLSPLQSSGNGASASSLTSAPAPQNNFRVSPVDMLQLGQVVANARKADAEATLLEQQSGTYDETHKAEMDLRKANITKTYAEIDSIVSKTLTEDSLRPFTVALADNNVYKAQAELNLLAQKVANEIQIGYNLQEEQKKIVQDVAYTLVQTQLAEKELKYVGFNNVTGGISKILGSVAGIGAGILGAGKGLSFLKGIFTPKRPIGFRK